MLKAARFIGWPLLAGVLLALLIIQRYPQWVGLPDQAVHLQQVRPAAASGQGQASYADAVSSAAPAVANLYSTKLVNKPAQQQPTKPGLYSDDVPKQRRMESSLGSAVIISPEGYLLTNNHVIEGADKIVVALMDGRETLAHVVGTDPETDLAVLKIDLADLPVITLGRSDQIRIGDVALAIGNPFGVGQTVTMGIISATGRNQLGINTYEDFIQTDAAINPGNSGGALIDAQGNLLGINTAIFSKSGGSQGIGFAIPTKLAMDVMRAIIQQGRVIRGWLGIEIQPMTPELAESFGMEGRPGIIVAGLYRNGPGYLAGLQPGDVILSIDGEPASNGRRSMNQVARSKPGESVVLEVLRNGKPLQFKAEVGLRPQPKAQDSSTD
ncbi:S1C family serine protease [Pseudomonas sp. N040]|uniref:S1C family serine protease n=1 Tax=Pseudomonas sp. N040 TaxID=2785325 RepID=UPI0018A24CC0|nr:trypsin-like peptidase domain-containing protein [Pseudomonas sp. N040]MBF7730319.1 trypsin-like peptidase domain-containing protein [Pseudomonas sp. N040]MBW7013961.1 trypsin-like peptidase domain-containing protein [Pseudomonas sp. N040]